MKLKLLLLLSVFAFTAQAQSTIHYVKAGSTGDGSSWANASGDLQLMIDNSVPGDQVWIAQGTYKPERIPGSNTITPNHRDNAFLLKSGVSIYGSFAGNESTISQRVYGGNATVLSGDFLDNDQFTSDAVAFWLTGNSENAHHLLIGLGLDAATVVDGLSFTRANANIYQNNSNISVNGYTVKRAQGAGLYLIASVARFNNLTFRECLGYTGGAGMYLEGAGTNLAFTNVKITYCRTGNEGSGFGIGIEIRNNAYAKFANLEMAWGYGRCAVSVLVGSTLDISNATFTKITAHPLSGAVIIVTNAHLNIYNSLFILNFPNYDILNADTSASATVKNVIGLGRISTTAVTESVLTRVNLSFVDLPNLNLNLPHYSQAIGFGNAAHLSQLFPDLTTDIAGKPRVMGSNIDIGALEYDYNYCYPPVVLASQDMCVQDGKVSTLYGVGFNIKWYDSAEGGTPLASTKKLISGHTYYATSGNGVCESVRVPSVPNLVYCGSKIVDSQCNSTVDFKTTIYAEERAGATAYRFTVKSGPQQQVIEKPVRYFRLNELPDYKYNTTYTIKVEVFGNGAWAGNNESCNVTTPAPPALKLKPEYCGQVVASFSTAVYSEYVPLVTGYRFRINYGSNTQVLEKSAGYFFVNEITGHTYGQSYHVEVAVQVAAEWGGYGPACTISTPHAMTQLAAGYCGATMPKKNAVVYANGVSQATRYRFRISNGGNTYILENAARYFILSNVPGNTYNRTYTVEVAAEVNGVWSDYGNACTVSTPGNTGRPGAGFEGITSVDGEMTTESADITLTSYPNPYSESFTLEMNTTSLDKVTVRAFDMTGKLVEDITISPEELASQKLGSSYAAGVYSVVVSQRDYQKAFKVVKK